MKVSKSNSVFFLLFFLGLIISALSYYVLPKSFFLDSKIIIFDKLNEIGLLGSYPFSIWFYKITGLKYLHFSIIGVIQFFIVYILLFKIGVPKEFNRLTGKNILIYVSIVILAIFISMPTKEFINFLCIFIIIRIFQKRNQNIKKTVFIGLSLILFFGFFFRRYYILIVFLMVVMYGISLIKLKNKRVISILYGILIMIGVSLSYGLLKGVFISHKTRELVNEHRIGSGNANSMIIPPLSTDTWYGESFGIVYGFFTVNLPINGLKFLFKPQIIAFVFWQLSLFIMLYRRYGRCLKEGEKGNYDIWMFYFLFSYFIIQGVFEPDLGSAARHKIGVFPLIYYLLNYEVFRKKI